MSLLGHTHFHAQAARGCLAFRVAGRPPAPPLEVWVTAMCDGHAAPGCRQCVPLGELQGTVER